MNIPSRTARLALICGLAALALSGCAASGTQAQSPVLSNAATGKTFNGTEAATRRGILAPGAAGFSGVLAALGQRPPSNNVSYTEFVTVLNNGNAAAFGSLALAQNGAAAGNSGVNAGDKVTIVEAAQTTLSRGN